MLLHLYGKRVHIGVNQGAAMSDNDLASKISENASGPKSMTTPDGSATAHDLQSQIAADRYLRSRAVARNPFAALCRRRLSFGRADGINVASARPQPYPVDEVPPR